MMSNSRDDLALFAEVLDEMPDPEPRTCTRPIGGCRSSDHFHPTMNTQLPRRFYEMWGRSNGHMSVHQAAKEVVDDALSGH